MKKITSFLLACFLFLLFVSCSKDIMIDDNSDVAHVPEMLKHISNNIRITKFHGKTTKSATGGYTIEPYVYKGDTIMYIANYKNGGWEVYSSDYRAPMVVASSDEGSFDINNIGAPAVRDYFGLIKDDLYTIKNKEFNHEDIDNSWRAVKLFNNEVDVNNIKKAPIARNLEPAKDGYWEFIGSSEPVITVETHPRLTETNWQQEDPWNMYVPYFTDSDKHSLTGCSPVAIGQFLYYMHYHIGSPVNTVTSATYNPSTNTYNYSGSSSSLWDLMAKNWYEPGAEYAALLIGYIGKSCNAQYAQNENNNEGTSVIRQNSINFLASMGFNFTDAAIDYSYVYSKLRSGTPVIAAAECTDESCGSHLFIIDGYEKTNSTHVNTYGWVGNDNMGNDTNERDDDGNIIGYSFTYEQTVSMSTYMLMMNWGYDRYYNGIKYTLSDWNAGGHHFNDKRHMFKEN